MTKVCSKCGVEKDIEEFGKDSSKSTGVHSQCKACAKEARIYRRLHPKAHRPEPKDGHKYCTKCGEEKPFSEFTPSKVTKSGYGSWCKKCNRDVAYNKLREDGVTKRRKYRKDDLADLPNGDRICIVCGKTLPIDEFEITKGKSGGHSYRCLNCAREYKYKWAKENRDKILASRKAKKEADPEAYKDKKHDEYMRHRDKYRESGKRYYEENKYAFIQQCIAYKKRRYKEMPHTKIADNMRQRVRAALKGLSKADHTLDMLGCTIEEYKTYLEQRFTPNMSWDNYGFYGWHIDHIIPLAMFDLSDPEEQKKAFHYSNTQPLWWSDNLKKGARYIG